MNKIAPCLACVRSMGRRVGRYHPRRVDESSAEMTKEEGRGDARNVSCSAVTAVSGRDGWRSSECATVCLLVRGINLYRVWPRAHETGQGEPIRIGLIPRLRRNLMWGLRKEPI
jgi:hypothetical protein